MSESMGVTVTIGTIYTLLLSYGDRLLKIETAITTEANEKLAAKEDSARIRKLQGQVAAMWVVHTIMLAAITANYVKGV